MEGRFRPGHRFKIRELAETMGVSETPIREALMQLVRARVLDMQASRSIEVARLSAAQYEELRVSGFCSKDWLPNAQPPGSPRLISPVSEVSSGAGRGRTRQALARSRPGELAIPPHALQGGRRARTARDDRDDLASQRPSAQHVVSACDPDLSGDGISISTCSTVWTARNPEAVKQSIRADLMEGGARLLQLLQDIEAGATPSELDAAVT